MMIMFPVMLGVMGGAGVLVVNAILFVIVKPASKRVAFFIGMLGHFDNLQHFSNPLLANI